MTHLGGPIADRVKHPERGHDIASRKHLDLDRPAAELCDPLGQPARARPRPRLITPPRRHHAPLLATLRQRRRRKAKRKRG